MIFAEFAVEQAEGIILAHSLNLPGGSLKKGRRLDSGDVEALQAAGFASVVGARLEVGDLGENDAADRVAAALAGANVTRAAAFAGRSNLFAAIDGLAVIDRERLDQLNQVDEAVTVATVAPWEVVAAGQMIATAKVIPFGVAQQTVDRCAGFAGEGGPIVSVRPFLPQQVGLILTTLPGTKEKLVEATAAASRARVASLGGSLVFESRCAHRGDALAAQISQALAAGCGLLLIAGASAIVDRRDVVPAAIVAAGGAIDHFGMPVDPGNLLLLARIGAVPVLGVPGCARSPRLNGVDFVFRRLMAGLPVTSRDIMVMGAGGLLKEIAERPLPRASVEAQKGGRRRIAGLVLAAGLSSRMGRNKLLIAVNGKPLVVHAAEAALAAGLDPVVVVTGHQVEAVRAALGNLPLAWAHNPDFADGLAGSLKTGLAALPPEADGVLVCLGDMPALTAEHLRRIVAAFNPTEGRSICIPTYQGKRGNPVLLGRQFFAEMRGLAGDSGARGLFARHDEALCEVAMPDDAVLTDLDTTEALARFVK